MNKITNAKELELEMKRLEVLLANKKRSLQLDFDELKTNLDPVNKIVQTVTNFTRPSTNNNALNLGLNAGLNAGVKMIMKNTFLGRAGFITKLVLPIIIKKIVKKKIQKQADLKRNVQITPS